MLKNRFNYVTMALTSICFIYFGISFLSDALVTWNRMYGVLFFIALIMGVIKVINLLLNFRNADKKVLKFFDLCIWIITIVVAILNPKVFYHILPKIIGCWILLHAIVKLIVLYIKIKDHLTIHLYRILFLFIDLSISSFLLTNPYQHHQLIGSCIGIYFIFYGCNRFLDLLKECIPSRKKEAINHHIQLAIPPFLSALLPPHLIRMLLNKDKEDEIKKEFDQIKDDIPIDLEVMIHLAPSGPSMLGHTDLIYRDNVISYGCYDPHNRHLFGTLGDGVVLVANKDTYLYNCLKNENKILISFGIHLTEQQKELVDQRIKEVQKTFVEFYSDEQKKQMKIPYDGPCDDYISRVTRTSPSSHFYKIKDGKLKTFFVLSTNCVCFMSNIISVLGFNLIDMSGIVSPGAYYDFMNKQFKSNKGFVISRKLYRKKDAEEFLHNAMK